MIDNFLNDLKVKGFISVSKDTENFDMIRKLEAEGLIEKKNQQTYILTKEGYKAADMGYDKFHLSLDLATKKTTKAPIEKPKSIKAIISKGWWYIIVPIAVGIVLLIIQKFYF